MNNQDALMMVFARNAFYRRLHFLVFAAFILAVLVIAVLIATIYYLVKNPNEPLYFATDSVGRFIEVTPVDKPNMSYNDVVKWSIEAVEAAYSYDYVNYRTQLQSAQKYFTNYGWSNYMKALMSSNNMLALTQRKMIVIAQVVDQPKLTAQGILGGAYAWKFDMPVLMTYWEPPFDDKSKFFNPLTVTIVVQRQPILQSDKGLGIVQIIGAMPVQSNQPQEISGSETTQ